VKIVRFRAGGKTRYGVLEGTRIVEYAGTPYGTFKKARKRYALRQTVLLAPVVPTKIVGVGLNYRDHAEEMSLPLPAEPNIFFKALSALCGPDDPIVFPPQAQQVDYEGELGVVIRKRCRNVPAERAREYILGYTCVNDVTARDLQRRDGQSSRAKSFDSFCPVGPCITTDIDPNSVQIEAWLNGERRQASTTKHLVFPVEDLVARISAVMTLLPGDLIATGTPAGVGPMQPGDRVEVRIEGIGSLRNPIVKIEERASGPDTRALRPGGAPQEAPAVPVR
jgi:2-keto-4-pentenoate hydratase/2-oxohepta-3-ene-1,7-dioic acid hydratase in catechol pathway